MREVYQPVGAGMCHARTMKTSVVLVLVLGLLALACGPRTKHDILARVDKVGTKTELEDALGAPAERNKLGPIETWTYEASDGSVTFVITGESVALQATGD